MKTFNKLLLTLAVAFAFGATAASACSIDDDLCMNNSPIVLIGETKSLF